MPFNSKSGKIAGKIGGGKRWKDKDPTTVRKQTILLKLSQTEFDVLMEKVKKLGISRNELIIRAVIAYDSDGST